MTYNQLIYTLYYILLTAVFVVGGALQFFIGFSNSLITLFFAAMGIVTYVLYVIITKKIILNKIVVFASICGFYIVINGFLNDTDWLKTSLYLVFVIVPLSCYLITRIFFSINQNITDSLYSFLLIVAKIQLPVLLIQRYFYDELIKFNKSSQHIDSIDFPFGTFFIKNDHGLGFLLICSIIFLLFDKRGSFHVKNTLLSSLYLSITVLFINSKITFVLLLVLWAFYLYKNTRTVYFTIIMFFVVSGLVYFSIESNYRDQIFAVENFITNHEHKRSLGFYNAGVAKRSHTLVVLFYEKFTMFGHGPYSYFNILTKEFYKGVNHSQWIWLLYDIGLLGVMFFVIFIFSLFLTNKPKKPALLLTMFSFIIYCYFTNVLSDMSFMLTTFIYLKSYER